MTNLKCLLEKSLRNFIFRKWNILGLEILTKCFIWDAEIPRHYLKSLVVCLFHKFMNFLFSLVTSDETYLHPFIYIVGKLKIQGNLHCRS